MQAIPAIRALRRSPWFAVDRRPHRRARHRRHRIDVQRREPCPPGTPSLPRSRPARVDRHLERRARAGLQELGLRLQRLAAADGDLRRSVEAYGHSSVHRHRHQSGPEGLAGWQFTPGLFATLGAPPAMGRTVTRKAGEAGRKARTARPDRTTWSCLSDRLVAPPVRRPGRCRRYRRSSSMAARTSIAGVMPPTFTHPYPLAQLWTPAALAERGARRPQAAALPGRGPAARRA